MLDVIASLQKPKNIIVVAPVIGAVFAILVDIGFFWSLGPAWFTFFSLTEHIELALSATPAAIFLVGLFYCGVLMTWLMHKAAKRYLLKPFDSSLEQQKRSLLSRPRTVFFLIVLLLADALSIYWMLKYRSYNELLIGAGLTLLTAIIVAVYVSVTRELTIVLFTLFLCIVSAFAFGSYHGYVVQSSKDQSYTLHLTDKHVLRGTTLIAGERGVLFFDRDSRRTQFWVWRQVDLLEREALFPAQ